MRILKITMIEDAGLKDQYIRPYEFGTKTADIDRFVKLSEGNAGRYTAPGISKVAHSILKPSTDIVLPAHIRGGWDQGRMMFSMLVELTADGGMFEYQYITGYTDTPKTAGINGNTVKFDYDMRLYFNTITHVHMTESSYKRKPVWQPKLMSHDQILRRSSLVGEDNRRRDSAIKPVSLRPKDLFQRQGGEHAFGQSMRKSSLNHENTVGTFNSEMRASTRANNSAASLLTRGLNAYTSTDSDPSQAYSGDLDSEEVINGAAQKADESDLSTDPWFEEYSHDCNILRSGYITYGELMDQQRGEFDEGRNVGFLSLSERRKTSERYRNRPGKDYHSSWHDGTVTAIAAYAISCSLPSLMLQAMYSKIDDLIIDTRARTTLGEPKVFATLPHPYLDGLDTDATLNFFETAVERTLLDEITQGGRLDISARINANIDTDIEIYISIDGDEEQYYLFPVYADGLLPPTMADGLEAIDHISKGIVDLSAAVSRSHHKNHSSHVDTPNVFADTDISSARRERDRRPEPAKSSALPSLSGAKSRTVRDI